MEPATSSAPKPTSKKNPRLPRPTVAGAVAWQALVCRCSSPRLLGTLSGVLFAYADDLPEISALDDYQPNTITRLLARDGQVIGEFAIERRVVIGYDDMAPVLRQAIIATEDGDFEQHFGLSVSRIVITAIRDVGTAALRRQHDHAAARARCSSRSTCRGVFARSG